MPAAAVIPAPLAYIKVVAVKKLVVELLAARSVGFGRTARRHPLVSHHSLHWPILGSRHFTLKKLECLRQAPA